MSHRAEHHPIEHRHIDHRHIDHRDIATFGSWLRTERQRRNLSIASIAESTKILGALFEGLENDNLSRWPDGFYRRSFVRAYAKAIGLNPEHVLREFLLHYPEADPTQKPVETPQPTATEMRLVIENVPSIDLAGLVRTARDRVVAISVDFLIVAVVTTALWWNVGLLWEPLAIVACGYYAVGILIFGQTPAMFAVRSVPRSVPRSGERSGLAIRLSMSGVLKRLIDWPFPPAPKDTEPVFAPPPRT